MAATRKIELMYRQFGKCHGRYCKGCSNLVKFTYRDKPLIKCKVYGVTHSEASDWVQKWTACGMFNREWRGGQIIRLVKPSKQERENDNAPIEGQLSMEV